MNIKNVFSPLMGRRKEVNHRTSSLFPLPSSFSPAFTIVELLMVIGIIAILLGIVTTAASESLRASRDRRASAVIAVMQSGLAAYYAVKEEWPMDFSGKEGNHKNESNDIDKNQYDLSYSEVKKCAYAVVETAKTGAPLVDVSGLWVSRSSGESDKYEQGMDFMSAIRGTRESSKKMKLTEMYFGYPRSSDGGFERYGMGYSIATDQLTVGRRGSYAGNRD